MNKKTKIIGFRTTKELFTLISEEARSTNIPVSWWLRGLVVDYLKKRNVKL